MKFSLPATAGKPRVCCLYRSFLRCNPFAVSYNGAIKGRSASSTSERPSRVDFNEIDAKWQKRWKKSSSHGSSAESARSGSKKKGFVLPMFPYPSGRLHLGHVRVYTISDVLARFKRMRGSAVIHPMGWDAFGLPAENAAFDRGVDPAEWTKQNISNMKEQLVAMGGSWDWGREFATCDPDFYKHTQRIFLMLHDAGLAYQAESFVNYDPVDKTVLANEQVDANGCSWRSGAKVQQIRLKQWFLKITQFKDALLEDLKVLSKDDCWPERVISMQKNWLGKSTGAKVPFRIQNSVTGHHYPPVDVFTTRGDTIHAVHYLALSLDHPIIQNLATGEESFGLRDFIDEAPALPPDTKKGFLLKNLEAFNPVGALKDASSLHKEPLPVFAAPYVRGDYGSGAVMGVPAHDTRDCAFFRDNTGATDVRTSVGPIGSTTESPADKVPFTEHGELKPLAAPFDGMSTAEAIPAILCALQDAGQKAELTTSWRLRDWLISRQRYWGTPIPIIHCSSCGTVPVPASDLPVTLPSLREGDLRGRRGNPLESMDDWVNVACPKCGQPGAKRETDTMDTFMDSSWYYFRFLDPNNRDVPFSSQEANAHMPVNLYIGGVEHAILHLLYARFIAKFLSSSTPLWPSGAQPSVRGEPFRRLLTQGMVHGRTYTCPSTGRFLRLDEVDSTEPGRPLIKASGDRANVSFEKMSKSKHNGVDASSVLARYGADVVRSQILFAAPPSDVLEWDEAHIPGVQRWLAKILKLSHTAQEARQRTESQPNTNREKDKNASLPRLDSLTEEEVVLWRVVDSTVRSVVESFDQTFALNTVVSDLMKLTNHLDSVVLCSSHTNLEGQGSGVADAVYVTAMETLLRMLAPIAPAIAEECWEIMHGPEKASSVFAESFPEPLPANIVEQKLAPRTQTCAVQLNGKLKFTAQIPVMPDLATTQVKASLTGEAAWVVGQVLETEQGREFFANSRIGPKLLEGIRSGEVKVLVVKSGKLVNFVHKRM